jgi:hypothetical protein
METGLRPGERSYAPARPLDAARRREKVLLIGAIERNVRHTDVPSRYVHIERFAL